MTNPSETMPNLETEFGRISSTSDKDIETPFQNNIDPPQNGFVNMKHTSKGPGYPIDQDLSNNP